MKFFDLHSHPSFKPIFNNKFTPWDFIKGHDRLLGGIISSQSCLQQFIMRGECNLICVSLYAVETEFIEGWLMRLGPIIGPLDRAIMRQMVAATFDYPEEVEQERTSLNPPGARDLHILTKWTDYKPDDFTKLYILFSIEGGHAFYGTGNKADIATILPDLTAFITKPDLLVFYITPCHLTPNIFMTHAHGVKILGKGKFIPRKKGIESEGKMFLNEIAKTKVLIDVKHMSLISRQEFYKTETWNERPILCSHTGVTGCSWNDKLNRNVVFRSFKRGPEFVKIRYKKPKGLLNETYCNPTSINLYNEDILYVLKSEGLIGISMDIRILGGDRKVYGVLKLNEKEFLSSEEFSLWEKQNTFAPLNKNDEDFPYPNVGWFNNELPDDIWDVEDREDEFEELNTLSEDDIQNVYSRSNVELGKESKRLYKERDDDHLRFFVNQLFHIVTVTKAANLKIDPWKHICIGSDFDGLIKAIDCCKDTTELNAFGDRLIDALDDLAREANVHLPRTADELVKDIFFNNANDFMNTHF